MARESEFMTSFHVVMSRRDDSKPTKDRCTSGDLPRRRSKAGTDDEHRDMLFVHGRSEGGSYRVVRSREQRIEVGEMSVPRDGQPIVGELVKLHPTEEHEQLFECETIAEAPVPKRASHGPAQVANEAYRSGWDMIFGASTSVDPSKLN